MNATYQQIQETIYAIGTARRANTEEWHQCVAGWGGENYHSEVIKQKGKRLLELQQFWEKELQEKTLNHYMNDVAKIPV
jgi:hypothetical protein